MFEISLMFLLAGLAAAGLEYPLTSAAAILLSAACMALRVGEGAPADGDDR
ncbi:hypothetical protein [Prosthecomicrobium sp. N25]|uniref:hypothetical protein n=1 Tax=Prosthecomicrobium sp. N25 TaxID=3129254 RepID=UPI003077A333